MAIWPAAVPTIYLSEICGAYAPAVVQVFLFWGAGVAQASSWSGLERCFSQAGFATANYYQIGLRFEICWG